MSAVYEQFRAQQTVNNLQGSVFRYLSQWPVIHQATTERFIGVWQTYAADLFQASTSPFRSDRPSHSNLMTALETLQRGTRKQVQMDLFNAWRLLPIAEEAIPLRETVIDMVHAFCFMMELYDFWYLEGYLMPNYASGYLRARPISPQAIVLHLANQAGFEWWKATGVVTIRMETLRMPEPHFRTHLDTVAFDAQQTPMDVFLAFYYHTDMDLSTETGQLLAHAREPFVEWAGLLTEFGIATVEDLARTLPDILFGILAPLVVAPTLLELEGWIVLARKWSDQAALRPLSLNTALQINLSDADMAVIYAFLYATSFLEEVVNAPLPESLDPDVQKALRDYLNREYHQRYIAPRFALLSRVLPDGAWSPELITLNQTLTDTAVQAETARIGVSRMVLAVVDAMQRVQGSTDPRLVALQERFQRFFAGPLDVCRLGKQGGMVRFFTKFMDLANQAGVPDEHVLLGFLPTGCQPEEIRGYPNTPEQWLISQFFLPVEQSATFIAERTLARARAMVASRRLSRITDMAAANAEYQERLVMQLTRESALNLETFTKMVDSVRNASTASYKTVRGFLESDPRILALLRDVHLYATDNDEAPTVSHLIKLWLDATHVQRISFYDKSLGLLFDSETGLRVPDMVGNPILAQAKNRYQGSTTSAETGNPATLSGALPDVSLRQVDLPPVGGIMMAVTDLNTAFVTAMGRDSPPVAPPTPAFGLTDIAEFDYDAPLPGDDLFSTALMPIVQRSAVVTPPPGPSAPLPADVIQFGDDIDEDINEDDPGFMETLNFVNRIAGSVTVNMAAIQAAHTVHAALPMEAPHVEEMIEQEAEAAPAVAAARTSLLVTNKKNGENPLIFRMEHGNGPEPLDLLEQETFAMAPNTVKSAYCLIDAVQQGRGDNWAVLRELFLNLQVLENCHAGNSAFGRKERGQGSSSVPKGGVISTVPLYFSLNAINVNQAVPASWEELQRIMYETRVSWRIVDPQGNVQPLQVFPLVKPQDREPDSYPYHHTAARWFHFLERWYNYFVTHPGVFQQEATVPEPHFRHYVSGAGPTPVTVTNVEKCLKEAAFLVNRHQEEAVLASQQMEIERHRFLRQEASVKLETAKTRLRLDGPIVSMNDQGLGTTMDTTVCFSLVHGPYEIVEPILNMHHLEPELYLVPKQATFTMRSRRDHNPETEQWLDAPRPAQFAEVINGLYKDRTKTSLYESANFGLLKCSPNTQRIPPTWYNADGVLEPHRVFSGDNNMIAEKNNSGIGGRPYFFTNDMGEPGPGVGAFASRKNGPYEDLINRDFDPHVNVEGFAYPDTWRTWLFFRDSGQTNNFHTVQVVNYTRAVRALRNAAFPIIGDVTDYAIREQWLHNTAPTTYARAMILGKYVNYAYATLSFSLSDELVKPRKVRERRTTTRVKEKKPVQERKRGSRARTEDEPAPPPKKRGPRGPRAPRADPEDEGPSMSTVYDPMPNLLDVHVTYLSDAAMGFDLDFPGLDFEMLGALAVEVPYMEAAVPQLALADPKQMMLDVIKQFNNETRPMLVQEAVLTMADTQNALNTAHHLIQLYQDYNYAVDRSVGAGFSRARDQMRELTNSARGQGLPTEDLARTQEELSRIHEQIESNLSQAAAQQQASRKRTLEDAFEPPEAKRARVEPVLTTANAMHMALAQQAPLARQVSALLKSLVPF